MKGERAVRAEETSFFVERFFLRRGIADIGGPVREQPTFHLSLFTFHISLFWHHLESCQGWANLLHGESDDVGKGAAYRLDDRTCVGLGRVAACFV